MENYENKTKEELLIIIHQLERKIENLSSKLPSSGKERFRDKYCTRILDALPDMLTVIDHNGNIIELVSSPSTNHVEGTTAESIIHSKVKDIIPEDAYESVHENMEKVIHTKQSSISRHNLMVNGTLHHFENRIFPLDNKYLLCICRDISRQYEMEKALDEARIKAEEADRLKSAFLANMSHEIRTPLNAIVGFSQLIATSSNTEDKKQYSAIVEKNSELLLNLFSDILDISALESDSLKFKIRPIKLLDNCVQLQQLYSPKVHKGVNLILDNEISSTYVIGDSERISQVISNLLSNATKFTIKGEIHFGFQEKEDFVEFYVKDSGIGIPAEKAASIFERFGKINNFVQGTGLGLTLCRMLVERMGGRIWLRSKEGQGTTFYFTLPKAHQ
ncbi:PAS domain-containing sensor histidine kinase [Bacteroides sp.]|uniref:sensor histidine kinase n=1 Tax=Bacteroides sp. TaxID=29523 RepID=UPI00262A77EF|nr:PAS domain-containing sensor histidine kinase [Bacteroides sp.]MDD3036968.1 PAS domain-containing sensor histidine kinase [Bacteroides sp.]